MDSDKDQANNPNDSGGDGSSTQGGDLQPSGAADGAAGGAQTPPAAPTRTVQARVLIDCAHGKPNDVVELATAAAKLAEKAGEVDTNKAAVAYALSLRQASTNAVLS